MQLNDTLHDAAAWFGLLSPDQQARVQQDISVARYPAGAIIERKGEKAYAWMGVLAGLVKVSVGNVDGKMASLTGVPPGGWIGEEIGRATCRERGTSAAAGASTSDMTPSVRWCDE